MRMRRKDEKEEYYSRCCSHSRARAQADSEAGAASGAGAASSPSFFFGS